MKGFSGIAKLVSLAILALSISGFLYFIPLSIPPTQTFPLGYDPNHIPKETGEAVEEITYDPFYGNKRL